MKSINRLIGAGITPRLRYALINKIWRNIECDSICKIIRSNIRDKIWDSIGKRNVTNNIYENIKINLRK